MANTCSTHGKRIEYCSGCVLESKADQSLAIEQLSKRLDVLWRRFKSPSDRKAMKESEDRFPLSCRTVLAVFEVAFESAPDESATEAIEQAFSDALASFISLRRVGVRAKIGINQYGFYIYKENDNNGTKGSDNRRQEEESNRLR